MLVNCTFLVVAAMQTPHIAPLRLQRPCVRIAPGVPCYTAYFVEMSGFSYFLYKWKSKKIFIAYLSSIRTAERPQTFYRLRLLFYLAFGRSVFSNQQTTLHQQPSSRSGSFPDCAANFFSCDFTRRSSFLISSAGGRSSG